MAIFIDLARYHVETGDAAASTIRVVRKADGAFFELSIDEEGPGFLWMHAAGLKDLKAHSEAWIDQTAERDGSNSLWTLPTR